MWIWQAFTELSYRRGAGFSGPLPISYSDILAYCSLKGIILAPDKERLCRFLDVLDKVYMAESYEKLKSEQPSPNPSHRHRTDVPRAPKRAPTKEVTPR